MMRAAAARARHGLRRIEPCQGHVFEATMRLSRLSRRAYHACRHGRLRRGFRRRATPTLPPAERHFAMKMKLARSPAIGSTFTRRSHMHDKPNDGF